MRNECNIVRDILPLYIEDIASADTVSFVEDHLRKCPDCQAEYVNMKKPIEIPAIKDVPKNDISPLKSMKRLLLIQKIQTIVFIAILLAVILIAAYAALDAPIYLPYTEDLLSISENLDGSITVLFSENVTDSKCLETKGDGAIYYSIEAWYSPWDMLTCNRKVQAETIVPPSGTPFSVFYLQNNGTEDVCLFRSSPIINGDRISLPHLTLLYYLILAAIAVGILSVLYFLNRKKSTARIWIMRLWTLPVSYILGHLIVCGFSTITYSIQHDFTAILFLTLLIYFAFLCVSEISRTAKEIKKYK